MSEAEIAKQTNPATSSERLYQFYVAIVSLSGVCLAILGVIQIPDDELTGFLLLALLAVAIQGTATLSFKATNFSVSSAVSLAAIAIFGPATAALIAIIAETALWLISIRTDRPPWKKAIVRLGFNSGMLGIATFFAGLAFVVMNNWLGDSLAALSLTWLVTAVVSDQANLWLLIIVLHLQMNVPPMDVWRDHRWAVPLNVAVNALGGAILAMAFIEFNILGILVFFLPIAASAYAFRMYARQTEAQMTKLEDLVTLRTSDLEHANTNLAEANEELEELSKEKDAFLAVLTHDMRTPLTSIKGYGSILRDRELDRTQQEHIAKVILRSQDTLLDIVNNLLEIGKLQSGTPILLERTSFDLALVVKSAAESLEASAMEKKITLNYEEVPSPVEVTADEKKIHRVILNLISNAVKYTPDEGEVFIDTSVSGKYAIVNVRDTGYGIPEDELPHIFDRYSRVKKHQTIAIGTGLGLAIVKSLVDAHDGEIDVTSKEGAGSTFTLKLPIQALPKQTE